MRHALEPDHLAAVSTLMTGERTSAKAAWLGACWGLGHTLTLLTAGAILVVLRAEMPAFAAEVFEFGVVLMLVGFGVRAIYQGVCRGPHGRTHSHAKPGDVRTRSHGPMDARTTTPGRRGARTGGKRRAHRARGGHAPVDGDAAQLSGAVWRRIDVGNGRAFGPARLADRPGGSTSHGRAHASHWRSAVSRPCSVCSGAIRSSAACSSRASKAPRRQSSGSLACDWDASGRLTWRVLWVRQFLDDSGACPGSSWLRGLSPRAVRRQPYGSPSPIGRASLRCLSTTVTDCPCSISASAVTVRILGGT